MPKTCFLDSKMNKMNNKLTLQSATIGTSPMYPDQNSHAATRTSRQAATMGTLPQSESSHTTANITIRNRKIRNIELIFLLFAFVIVVFSFFQVAQNTKIPVGSDRIFLMSAGALVALGIHVLLRVQSSSADPFLLPIGVLLNGLGLVTIHRLDLASTPINKTAYNQMAYTILALAVVFVLLLTVKNYKSIQRYTFIFGGVSLVLLLLPLVPGLALQSANARVWIRIGLLNFQPAELAKITLAIFFAGYLVVARDSLSIVSRKFLGLRLPRAKDLGPIALVWGCCMGILIFQKDLGTSLLYFGLFLVMLFVSTGRMSWVIIGLGLFALGAVWIGSRTQYVQFRILSWLNPFDQDIYNATGGSYQLVQGIFGIGNGGIIGTGLGVGYPHITPLAESDFIIASIGEELGLAGLFAVFTLYLILISRGLRIAHHCKDDFGRLLALGVSFIFAMQVFIVVGGVTKIIPLTGLTAPLLAAGGSSLLSNWIMIAILIKLSTNLKHHTIITPAKE